MNRHDRDQFNTDHESLESNLMDCIWDWPFSLGELTAGLRRRLQDKTARVVNVRPFPLKESRPAIGILRAFHLDYRIQGKQDTIDLVVKEPRGTTRKGLAGAGRREAGVYNRLASEIPLQIPDCFAAATTGDWILLDLIENVRSRDEWRIAEYQRALQDLVVLHDRFWDLDIDLAAFTWLSRPLSVDFEVHVNAAARSVEHIVYYGEPVQLTRNPRKMAMLATLTTEADRVVAPLLSQKNTMIHGDYWPGNIAAFAKPPHLVYDWQLTGIAPGVLDLVNFVKKSEWWYEKLPLTDTEMQAYYRAMMKDQAGREWPEEEWSLIWDHALMWHFMQDWLDVIAASPDAVFEVRTDALERVWLEPVMAAVERRL